MATKKSTKKARSATTSAKTTARRASKPTAAKKARPRAATTAKAKPVAKPKAVAAKPAAPKRAAAAPKRPVAKPTQGPVVNAEVTSLKNKFQRERSGLERRLTEAVREIGILRHHELRAMQLERQLAERDAIIERLQAQLVELQRRPAEPVYVHEVQQSLALGVVSRDDDAEGADLDEFEEEQLVDDGDLISDD